MKKQIEYRTLKAWMTAPRFEETINDNPFRTAVKRAFAGTIEPDPLSPFAEEKEPLENKIAKLLPYDIIIPDGDVIYIMDGKEAIPLGEAMDLLRAYLSVSMKDTVKAAHILEQNFMGRWPVRSGKVSKDTFDLSVPFEDLVGMATQDSFRINLRSGGVSRETVDTIAEIGSGEANEERVALLHKVFGIWNTAIGEDHWFEKVAMYPFKQKFREKAFILNGSGGDGKGIFTELLSRLYGHLMLANAPVPSFSGHDRFTATRSFIGKKLVVFNDVEDPGSQFMEWLKPMTTGGMMVKELSSSSLVTMPCVATFMLETNFSPEFLLDNSHIRRFVFRSFPPEFELDQHLNDDELDTLGERGSITAADMIQYLTSIETEWIAFKPSVLPEPDYFGLADELPGVWTKHQLQQFCKDNQLTSAEKQTLKRKLEKEKRL